jgi:hypothetical protein
LGSKQFAKKQHRKLGKVDALLNEKLEKVEWGEFKLGDLFGKATRGKRLKSDDRIPGSLPFVTAGETSEGISAFIGNEVDIFPENTTTIDMFGSAKFRNYKYGGDDHIAVVHTENLPKYASKFVTTAIHKTSYNGQFNYGRNFYAKDADELKIQLPTQNGNIDFAFMENFIAEIENERISKLANYLEVSGLIDYTLTEEEKEVLESFRNSKTSKKGGVIDNQIVTRFEWKEFRLGDLFEINSSKKRYDANKVEISEVGQPYVVRTSLNNGIRGFINEEEQFINYGNTISFGQDTATMFYQEHPYFTGDKIKIVKSKDQNFNKKNAQFFITTMTKSFSSFSWGGSSFNVNVISSQMLNLPVQNNQPNYAIMETFISAIQKLVIKDVVLYANKKIAGTKSVVTKKE